MLPLPEYVTELIGDEDRSTVSCEAQRSRSFWEIPGMQFKDQVGECRRENEPLATKFRPIQLPHFKLLVLSNRDKVLEFCVNCREANWTRFQKFCRSLFI